MKHTLIETDRHVCPWGKLVEIYFVATLPAPNNYVVVLKQDGNWVAQTEPISKEVAYDVADHQADLPGAHGDTSWRAVLARLLGTAETPAQWKGSNAEYASRHPVGTRAWLDALLTHRAYTSIGLTPA